MHPGLLEEADPGLRFEFFKRLVKDCGEEAFGMPNEEVQQQFGRGSVVAMLRGARAVRAA